MTRINFTRMNGLGNDFLIYDARKQGAMRQFSKAEILKLCSRDNKETRGCDQLIIIANSNRANVGMLVFNADSTEVAACGNASRCIVQMLADEGRNGNITIETKADILMGQVVDRNMVAVDMGKPIFDWKRIPLARDVDIENLPIDVDGLEEVLGKPFALSMGNPHMVFTTMINVEDINVSSVAKPLEYHPLFPQRTNVGFAQIIDRGRINLRVYERSAGETLACGTGACAAVVAAIKRNLCDRKVVVNTHGGMMLIEWRENDGHVLMTGPVESEGSVTASI